MFDETIITDSPVGQRLEMMSNKDAVSYLMFNNKRIDLVAKITIGRSSDNDVVVDNKLASRYHAIIQKIKNAYNNGITFWRNASEIQNYSLSNGIV